MKRIGSSMPAHLSLIMMDEHIGWQHPIAKSCPADVRLLHNWHRSGLFMLVESHPPEPLLKASQVGRPADRASAGASN